MGPQGSCQGDTLELQQGLKLKQITLFYVHCYAHCLNLVLVDSTKSVPESEIFFSLLQKLYVYMSGSYVHQKWLSVQK